MSPIARNTWAWSLRRSPLIMIARNLMGFHRPNARAFVLLDEAALPSPVDEVIRTTITRTRLWRSERATIARELITHAQDALERGRSPGSVVETFGDPRRVARLLRRSMKRKRPVSWKLYRMSRRAIVGVVVLLVVGYGWLAARFFLVQPSVSVDYAALLDERYADIPEDQKSWAVLLEAGYQWQVVSLALSQSQTPPADGEDARTQGVYSLPDLAPDHPDYEEMVGVVRAFEPQLEAVREAAGREVIGIPLLSEGVKEPLDDSGTRDAVRSVVPLERVDGESVPLIRVLLPHLGYTRQLTNVLLFDARVAVEEGDTDRAVEDSIAALNLARQNKGDPFLISSFVGIAIHEASMKEIERLLRSHDGVLSGDQIARLAHTHAQASRESGMGLETERFVFEDYIQRVYSDDGHGDGHLTAAGMEYASSLITPVNLGEMDEEGGAFETMALPVGQVVSNSRREEMALYNELMGRLERSLERGPQWSGLSQHTNQMIDQHRWESRRSPGGFSAVGYLMPALGNAVERAHRSHQFQEGFSLLLGLEAYRIDHGAWPRSVGELVPRYLPGVPDDLMDPGHGLRFVAEGDGVLIYSVGSDGDDDGGRGFASAAVQDKMDASLFGRRYPLAYHTETGEVMVTPDGMPIHREPQGPDGDWILFDTRPESSGADGPSPEAP